MKRLSIAIIGAGNVAWHLVPALENAGHAIKIIFNRSANKIVDQIVSKTYSAEVTHSLDFSGKEIDLVLMMVKDDAIQKILDQLIVDDETIVAHTAGSKGIDIFKDSHIKKYGAWYPLQTFSKTKLLDCSNIPFFTEANNEQSLSILDNVAATISQVPVQHLDTESRRTLHISAVFACNFVNHMMSISQTIMEDVGISFDVMEPLVKEAVAKAFEIGPQQSQTGPAVRGDNKLIKSHLKALRSFKNWRKLYKDISDDIQDGAIEY